MSEVDGTLPSVPYSETSSVGFSASYDSNERHSPRRTLNKSNGVAVAGDKDIIADSTSE